MASNFDSLWEQMANRMDDAIDERLADSVEYAIDGVTFAVMPAFIIDEVTGEGSLEGLDDDFAVRKRVKMRKALIGEPRLSHRIRHPRLGTGTFKPTNSVPQSEGRYWLFDVQKAN